MYSPLLVSLVSCALTFFVPTARREPVPEPLRQRAARAIGPKRMVFVIPRRDWADPPTCHVLRRLRSFRPAVDLIVRPATWRV
jgi:hypothetical protein